MSDPGESDVKLCPQCGQTLPLTDFHRTRRRAEGLARHCRRCAAERSEAGRRAGGIKGRRQHPRRRSGVRLVEFDELIAAQDGRCAICDAPDPEHLDHDHRTGWVRGILCFNCNGGLGQFRDSPELLAQAVSYLKGTTWQRVLIHPGVYQMCSPMRGRPPSRSF